MRSGRKRSERSRVTPNPESELRPFSRLIYVWLWMKHLLAVLILSITAKNSSFNQFDPHVFFIPRCASLDTEMNAASAHMYKCTYIFLFVCINIWLALTSVFQWIEWISIHGYHISKKEKVHEDLFGCSCPFKLTCTGVDPFMRVACHKQFPLHLIPLLSSPHMVPSADWTVVLPVAIFSATTHHVPLTCLPVPVFLLLFVCLCFLSIPLASVLPPPLPMSSSSLLLSPPSCSPLLSHSIPLTFFLHPASTCSWCYSFSRPFNNPWCLFVHAGVCTRTFLYFCFYSMCLYYASTSVHMCVVNLEREGC